MRTLSRLLPVPVAVALLAGATATLQAAELRLRILETSDVHMNLLNYDYYQDKVTDDYGLAKTITLIKAARAEAKNSLLFDNGDLLQGSPLGDWVARDWLARDSVARMQPLAPGQVHPAYKVLNAIGVDAANIGNHEFNYGLPFLRQALSGTAFPTVSANVHVDDGDGNPDNDGYAFTPYVILDRHFTDEAGAPHTLKIGVIGFVPPQILVWDKQHLQGRLTVRDIQDTARRLVPEMRAKGAQIVVAIPHSGFERGPTPRFAENSVARLAEVPGIDAILFGHSHGEFPGPFFADYPKVDLAKGTINGVPAVMPGRWGDHLGVIDLTLDNASGEWRVSNSHAEIRPITDRATRQPLVAADPMVAALIATEQAATLAYVRGELGSTRTPITSYFAQVTPDLSVQIVARAQADHARRALQGTELEGLPLLSAAAPFKAGGRMGWRYYTDIPAGSLSLRNVADLYLYPNTVKAVRLSGAAVRDWLEMSAGQFNRIDAAGPPVQNLLNEAFKPYNFDMIDGLTYQIDVTQPARFDAEGKRLAPAAQRIVGLAYQGRPLDDAALFVVVTNNYRASGGGGFPGLDGSNIVVDSPDETRDALVQYLRAASPLGPAADLAGDKTGTPPWRILPVPGVALRFLSGSGALAHLARYPQIKRVQDNADGSTLFELAP